SPRLYEHEGGKMGEANLNGRMHTSVGGVGELREKYNVTVMDVEGKPRVYLRHLGTPTLTVQLDTKEILHLYGESVSDRDSINTLLYVIGMESGCRYFPYTCSYVTDSNGFTISDSL